MRMGAHNDDTSVCDRNGRVPRPNRADDWLEMHGEPDHQGLCDREQDFVYRAITEDLDLTRHMNDAVPSLEICLAADESVRSGRAIKL